jgi:hypothetical protein
MAYCRWSSNNFQCDIYIYSDVNGGYTTHVAANKTIGDHPKRLDITTPGITPEQWLESNAALEKFLESAQRVPLGLPYDGKSYNDATPELAIARLEELKRVGYRFPDGVIDALREEIEE